MSKSWKEKCCSWCDRTYVNKDWRVIEEEGLEEEEIPNDYRIYANYCEACFHLWIDGNSSHYLADKIIFFAGILSDDIEHGVPTKYLKPLAEEISESIKYLDKEGEIK